MNLAPTQEEQKLPGERWNLNDDIMMFQMFKNMASQNGLSTQSFLGPIKPVLKAHKHFLKSLMDQTNWKGKLNNLLKRIQKLLKSDSFSSRDIRRLKKLIRMNIKGQASYDEILKQFPGKTMQQIQKFKSTYHPKY